MPYLFIDNKKIKYKAKETILEIAKRENIEIANLCYHPDFKPKATCRLCLVEIKGRKDLVTACSTIPEPNMQVKTDTKAIRKARGVNLELLFASHREECADCVLLNDCPLLKYAKKYKLFIGRFKDRKDSRKVHYFSNAVEIDHTQCIDCGTCIQACKDKQKINCLQFKNKAFKQEIDIIKENPCIYCGQCALHCPVFSAQEVVNWPKVEKILKEKAKNKILVAQIAPSIRASLGQAFGKSGSAVSIGQIASALKQIGFDYVFDVNFAADITTIVEAEELKERLADSKAKLPLLTSCCPAWISYVENYQPQLIPYLTTSRSPQIHSGGLIKTYFSKLKKIKAQDIIVVSIMPCTAKKHESSREELKIKGQKPVDEVITSREFAFLLQRQNIDPSTLKASKLDDPLAKHSGSAAIFGGSGGVMQSALSLIANKKEKLDFKAIQGKQGIKEASYKIKGKKLNILVVNGIASISYLLDNLSKYHYAEIMACPGGCVGGGGQIIPSSQEIIKQRAKVLRSINKNKKLKIASENREAKKAIKWLKDNKLEHKVLHTSYKKIINK